MSDDLLRYYNAELAFLRRLGAEFAEAYPAVAANLGLGIDGETDPSVGRMVEAFALLAGRTRLKIDDEFPEICGSMLDVLYPHYQRPTPSTAIIACELSDDHADLLEGYTVERGRALVTEQIDGEACRYRTCYETRCFPIRVASARHEAAPLSGPPVAAARSAEAGVRLSLRPLADKKPISAMKTDRLRFYLRGTAPYSFQLYEALLRDCVGVAVFDDRSDPTCDTLPASAVKAVGFESDEVLFDYPATSLPGYSMLTEFFATPQKYLFVEIELGDTLRRRQTPGVELYFYLGRYNAELDTQVEAGTFVLGATPIVNLQKMRAEQIRLDHYEAAYPLVVDSRRPHAYEVYSIDGVRGVDESRREHEVLPFYAPRHDADGREKRLYWHDSRRERFRPPSRPTRGRYGGTEVELSLVDLDFNPLEPNDWTLDIEVTCVNRDLPNRLPYAPGRPEIRLEEESLATVECISPPTPTRRPSLGQSLRWRLVSHLTLNHLSLTSDRLGTDALREILNLYNPRDAADARRMIDGVAGVAASSVVTRVPGPVGSVACRGLEIALTLDSDAFSDGSEFLFASVLDRFFAMYAHVNSFTRTVLVPTTPEREPHRWPPRSGVKPLL